ncbi:MAG: hypothetical protein DWQ11_12475 [Proteobacteria bacterium]|nr:MAG: hypothetical protein DWQ11_12475 [Pseudomonadota bacterium]
MPIDETTLQQVSHLREQWAHEDNLINHRVGWLLQSQGLLLTAFAIFIQTWLTAGTDERIAVRPAMIAFPIVGMLSTAIIHDAIRMAVKAQAAIERRYARLPVNPEHWPLHPLPFASNAHNTAALMAQVFAVLWLLTLFWAIARVAG